MWILTPPFKIQSGSCHAPWQDPVVTRFSYLFILSGPFLIQGRPRRCREKPKGEQEELKESTGSPKEDQVRPKGGPALPKEAEGISNASHVGASRPQKSRKNLRSDFSKKASDIQDTLNGKSTSTGKYHESRDFGGVRMFGIP